MNSAAKELIDKIKTIRKEKRLSQIELAKRCNVPQSTIGRIENHSMNPSIDTLINILDVLNMSSSGASKLILKLLELQIIKPVFGHGKGKYCFNIVGVKYE